MASTSAPRTPRSSSAVARAEAGSTGIRKEEAATVAVRYADVQPGAELEPKSYQVTRLSLVKYAGASGDFNVIHWNERIAKAVGLPDVIAHGMFTMAQASRYVTEWTGDPGAVVEFG